MIPQILIALLTFAGSGLAFWISARLRSDSRKSSGWPTAPGRIVERGIQPLQTDGRSFTPSLKYRYTVAGKEYAGHQVYRTGSVGSVKQSAQRLVDGLPESIPVHYNPENPSEAFLLANPNRIFWIAALFGVGALVWGVLQVLTLVMQ